MAAVFGRLKSSLETIAETSKCANQLTIDFTLSCCLLCSWHGTAIVEFFRLPPHEYGPRVLVREFLSRSQELRKSQRSGEKNGHLHHIVGIAAGKEDTHGALSRVDGASSTGWLQLSKMLYSFQIPPEIFVGQLNEVKIECPGKKSTPKEARIPREPGEYLAARGCIGSLDSGSS